MKFLLDYCTATCYGLNNIESCVRARPSCRIFYARGKVVSCEDRTCSFAKQACSVPDIGQIRANFFFIVKAAPVFSLYFTDVRRRGRMMRAGNNLEKQSQVHDAAGAAAIADHCILQCAQPSGRVAMTSNEAFAAGPDCGAFCTNGPKHPSRFIAGYCSLQWSSSMRRALL
jgi:hypothetical protein